MSDPTLVAVLMPDGTISLEWEEGGSAIGNGRKDFQKEIYRRYLSQDDSWLLFLGFSDPATPLSDSLHFWREFAAEFTGRLVKHPDIESLRERIDLPGTWKGSHGTLKRRP